MRLSCNGCRVLRKGCSDACTIRPCLHWIKSPDAQANATVFLAKFYGRAGLLNLINAGADDTVRPAIFRSLLYEACGRIVNPVCGSVGLLWSGSWHLCQAAVEAVLKGAPIVRISDDQQAASPSLDIRHVAGSKPSAPSSSSSLQEQDHHLPAPPSKPNDLLKVAKPGRTRFKRTDSNNKQRPLHHQEAAPPVDQHEQTEMEPSLDTDAEAGSHVSQAEQQQSNEQEEEVQKQQLGLDLTLAFAPLPAAACVPSPPPTAAGWSAGEPGVVAFRFL